MANYTFSFPITPKIGRTWPNKKTCDGFEIEVRDDELLLCIDSADGSDDRLKANAQELAACLIAAMSFQEKQPLSGVLGRVVKTFPDGRTGTALLPSDKMEMGDRVDFVVEASHSADAYVVLDSRAVEADVITTFALRARRSVSLKHMLDWMEEFHRDPDRKLAPLFDIVELVEKELGGLDKTRDRLGISRQGLEKAMQVANDDSIRTARHPGVRPTSLREITPEELNHCIKTAEAIIRSYAENVIG